MAWSCNAPWMRGAPKPSPGHAARSRTTAAEIGTTLLDAAFSDALASLVRVRGQRLGDSPACVAIGSAGRRAGPCARA